MSAALRVADVIRSGWAAYNRAHSLPPHVVKAVRHLLRCRTAALGGHIHECDHCGSEVPMYNSCQTRHCPTCQTGSKEKWLAQRREELLPVQYFHVVFTLPVVYSKPTPAGGAKALDYLARYTHKVAISDHRILSLNDGVVTYTWRDRADGNAVKTDRLPVEAFTRRFCAHILPPGFVKIRYAGETGSGLV